MYNSHEWDFPPLSSNPWLTFMAKCSWISTEKKMSINRTKTKAWKHPAASRMWSHKDGSSYRKHSWKQRILLPQKASVQLSDELPLNGNCHLICKISSLCLRRFHECVQCSEIGQANTWCEDVTELEDNGPSHSPPYVKQLKVCWRQINQHPDLIFTSISSNHFNTWELPADVTPSWLGYAKCKCVDLCWDF